MTIRAMQGFDKYPKPQFWRRVAKRICGGQDFVAVVFVTESGHKETRWFTGVDMEKPVDVEMCASVSNSVVKLSRKHY